MDKIIQQWITRFNLILTKIKEKCRKYAIVSATALHSKLEKKRIEDA